MYNVQLGSSQYFSAFLEVKAADYVDVILSESMALFIQNSNEVFSMLGVPCSRMTKDTNVSFRVERVLFKSLFRQGDLGVTQQNDSVILEFYDEHRALICSAECKHQMVFDSVYAAKIELLGQAKNCERFDSDELVSVAKVASLLGGIISVDSGVASVTHRATERIYKKVSLSGTFALSPQGFASLRRCSHKFYDLQEYVGAEDKNFAVLVNKVRAEENQEFESICGSASVYKSKYVADVNFSNLQGFLVSQKIEAGELVVKLEKQMVEICEGGVRYEIPINVTNERMSKNAEFKEFVVPTKVLTKMLFPSGIGRVRLAKKRSFIELYANDVYVLFG